MFLGDMVCLTHKISDRLDLSARYQQVWNEYQQDEEIRQVQKQWLKSRDACRDVKCLSNHYTQRLASLKEPFLAPFGYYLNESLPQQRRTPVCKDFKHYLNYPRSNALFNPDGTLVRESDLFKSVHWEPLDRAQYRDKFAAELEVTRASGDTKNVVMNNWLSRYDNPQWVLQRTRAFPFEFFPQPEPRQLWMFRLVNTWPRTTTMNDPHTRAQLPTWFHSGSKAYLGYEDGSLLANNRHDLLGGTAGQWITYAGVTYVVSNETYDSDKGESPSHLNLRIDGLEIDPNGQSYLSFTCYFRAKNHQ